MKYNGCSFLKVDRKLSHREAKVGISLTFTAYIAAIITATVKENIIMDKNGLVRTSQASLIVCGVNKQALHIRATVASLGTSINVIWRERLKGRKTAVTRRLNGARILSPALSTHPFVFRYISNVRLIS